MRLRRISLWFGLGILAVLVLAIGWLWFADLGVIKPQLEKWVTESTGREFSIDGDLHIDLAGTSVVIAEGVRLQNADWADEPDMVSVGRIELRVDLWSLFSGPVIVELIDLDDVEAYLALVEGQEPNWRFPVRQEVEPAPADRPDTGLGVRLPHVDVDNVRIRYDSFERDAPLELVVESLTQELRDDEWLVFDLDATLNGKQVSIDGESGTWEAMLSGRDIRFDINVTLDTLQMSANGTLDNVTDLRRPEIEFTATAPDIDDVTRLLGIGEEGEGDIKLKGSLGPGDDGLVHFAVDGNIGRTEIESKGAVTDLRDYGTVDIELRSSAPDLGRVLRIAGIHNVREAPLEIVIDAERRGPLFEIHEAKGIFAGARFSAQAHLPRFPDVHEGNAELHITGEAIERLLYSTGMPDVASGPFDVTLGVSSSGSAPPKIKLDAHSPLGKAQLRGQVGPGPKFAGTELEVSAGIENVSRLAAAYGLKATMPEWPASIEASLAVDEGGIRTTKAAALQLGDHEAGIDGRIALAAGLQGSRVAVDIRSGNLAALVGGFADSKYVPALPLALNATLLADPRGLRIQQAKGSLGSASVEGDGLLTFARGIAGSRFSAKLDGPAFEEFEDSFAGLRVRKGEFELSGSIAFSAHAIALDKIELERPGGKANLDLEIGRSTEDPWMKFDAAARGRDVTALFHGKGGFEFLPLPFSLSVEGDHHGNRWSFLNAKASLGEASATADGVIDLRGAASSARFELQVAVPSLAKFGRFSDRAFRDQALSLDAEVRGGDGMLSAKQFNLKIGDSDVHGDLDIKAGDVPEFHVVVNSNSVVVAPILEDPEAPPEPVALQGDGRMFPDIALPFDALAKFDAVLDLEVGQFQYDKIALRNVSLDATVRDGVLDVPDFAFDPVTGSARGQMRLDPAGGSGAGYLRFVGRNVYLGLMGADATARPHGDWDVNLEFTGRNLRSMLGGANGVVLIRRFGGQIDKGNRFVQALYGDLLEQILDTINPFRKTDPYTPLECIVVATEISNGKLRSAPSSLVSTDKLLIVITSSIDLATEKLELGIRTEPKRRLSVSVAELINPYIQVVGTMAAPRLAVDQQGVLITGGAAVATGGLTILAQGLWSRLSRSNDPCGQAVQVGMENLGDRLPQLEVRESGAP